MSYRYFFLNSESIIVNGRQTTAIYDLTKGDIIALEHEMATVLQLAEAGFTIEQIASLLKGEIVSVKSIFKRVETLGLGRFYDRRLYIEKSKEGKLPRGLNTMRTPIIRRLFIELSSECGLGCTFCQTPKLNQCAMCSMPIAVAHTHTGYLYSFLERILKVSCVSLIFRGGDPLVQRVEFFELVKFCRELGFKGQIFVITNGTAIDGVSIAYMQSYGVHPVIPFTGDNSGLISDQMLRKLVQTMERGQIKFTLALLTSCETAENAEFLKKWGKQLGAVNVNQVILMDVLSHRRNDRIEQAFGKQISRISGPLFYHNAEFHPCLHGTLAVSADGMLMPCPFLRAESLGTISDPLIIDEGFETEKIDKYWQISLSQIEGCRECAFRYGCLDCRAVERALTGSIYDKKICSLIDS
jgi:radical SAM protein with 4Fe4S-binding SPASM domain